ncbi:MAG TPA: RICIN domain-containing protein [Segeticoccus sp.]|uniref:RICIN domain-containing protein n=1 Tax=Segeticoccus sp. TaxID=2706531 RepID=UPI002D80CB79|nr:RICIN domain-containing protein [Segeticoccus sp.]HET8598849.1 RICIN domain-containing protein [Segeticoccus sp.]
MTRRSRARVVALTATVATALGVIGTTSAEADTGPGTNSGSAFSVSVGSRGPWSNPDDTPAGTFIDRNGTFYYQQSHALYGQDAPRAWDFYTGSNVDTAARSSTSDAADPGNPLDSNADTTWRCNHSPTGLESTFAPAGSRYSQRNYCDLVGVWVDPDTGNWYGLVHNEFTPQPFGDGLHFDAIDYAVSTDDGRTWTIKDHVITSPFSTTRGDSGAFPEQTYDYGDGDPRLFVDARSGYFYVYYGSRIVDKGGSWRAFYSHVARAPISAKMAPSSWHKWYDGRWSQPGQGGQESNLVPVTAEDPDGYTPPAKEYDPRNPGTTAEQVAAGTTPPTSPLFVMDITYDAYLGLYIGEPQNVDQSGNAPQQYYATDNLATQKWTLIGDTGGYHTASWYRWFLDPVNKTSTSIVGKDFRAYCSFGCSDGRYAEYVNVSIDSPAPAHPVATDTAYRISSARGWLLAQAPHSHATTSVRTDKGLASWAFVANGDGSYRIVNTATGGVLGVDSGSTRGRAWGAQPTVTPPSEDGPSVGQQWFVLPDTSATDGSATGTVRIVNRYSGLVLGVSHHPDRLVETTPVRSWTDRTRGKRGAPRTAAEQVLTLTPVR